MRNKRGSTEPRMSESDYEARGTIFQNCSYTSTDGTTGSTAWYAFQDNTSGLLGKVLTIIDATYANKEQCEAVKSLVRDAFSNYRSPATWTVNGTCTGGNSTTTTFTQ